MDLSIKTLEECGQFILKNARPLECELYKYNFLGGEARKVIDELKYFQNYDGGFGHGLEPDTLLPKSSPFQTTVGLAHLRDFENNPLAQKMIENAISYLEKTFDKKRVGWFTLPKEANNYPHTPWWEYNEEEGMTPIDHHYGNPTAEIISYLIRYKQYVKNLNIEDLVNNILGYIEKIDIFTSEHELYCFISLYHELKGIQKERLESAIKKGVEQLIDYGSEKWATTYTPQPLHFIKYRNMNYLGIDNKEIEKNLDYLVKSLEENKKLYPSWGDSFYSGEFKKSYESWISIKTLEAILTIKEFGRIVNYYEEVKETSI